MLYLIKQADKVENKNILSIMKLKELTAISLFSGAGGMDLGFHKSNMFNTLACFEYNSDFSDTLSRNVHKFHTEDTLPTEIVNCDLSDNSIIRHIGRIYKNVDMVYGGPPCQSFSIMGKKGSVEDPRGALIYSFEKVLAAVEPRAFVFENVPNFASIERGRIARDLIRKFNELGFSTWHGVLCAADFGAYTFRRRFFILGLSGDRAPQSPNVTHRNQNNEASMVTGVPDWKGCGEVFKAIDKWQQAGKELENHVPVRHTPAVVARFSALKFGETDHIRKRNRLDPSRPAHSIYVGGVTGKLQARTHIHPFLPRELTARECAAIQGFPLDWKFCGKSDSVLLQAANAVPVELAESLGRHMASELSLGENNARRQAI